MINLQTFNAIDPTQSVFLIRHAEKHIIEGSGSDLGVSITAEGHKAASELGLEFVNKFGKTIHVHSSPILRCVETAQAFAQAYESKQPEIFQTVKLGKPGVFVENGELAGKSFETFGACGVVQRYLGPTQIPGMRSLDEAMKLLLEDIKESIDQQQGPVIFVTHDAILASFAGALTDELISEDNWPTYLGGVCLERTEDNAYTLHWNNQLFNVSDKIEQFLPSSTFSFSL